MKTEKTLIFLFLIICTNTSHALTGLINQEFTGFATDVLESSSQFSEIEDMLQSVVDSDPVTRILVIDAEIARPELRGPVITWRDTRVEAEEYAPYSDYLNQSVQSIAFHIAENLEMQTIPNRPLIQHPMVVLKDRSPRHAVLHELVHWAINRNSRPPILSLDSDPLMQERLNEIHEKVGEEVFVDSYLISRPSHFALSTDDLCFRARYLYQNLQLLNFFIDELPAAEAQVSTDAVNELINGYNSSLDLYVSTRERCGEFRAVMIRRKRTR